MKSKIIFIFLDGFGVGKAEDQNPIYRFKVFEHVVKVPLINGIYVNSDRLIVKGIDACMKIPGIPQSATGQTALFTGINTAELLGYHLPAYPCNRLQQKIWESNIMLETIRLGRTVTFANAYRNEYFDSVASGKLMHSVTTHACLAAGLTLRDIVSYQKHEAVFWDITGHTTKEHSQTHIEEISPECAGSIICALSGKYDFVVFESFLPDLIGHSRSMDKAEEFCYILDRFLTTIVEGIDGRTTVVVTSDHGNMEDLSIGLHTLNPVVLFAYGADAARFINVETIVDFPGVVLSVLGK